jgi:hypothetical protein
MKTDTEKILKEKIDSMGTLTGGIVFGKEEAWEKLQARMDAPARRIPIRFWMAAAAILLILITIFTIFNEPSKKAETLAVKKSIKATENTITPPALVAPVADIQITEPATTNRETPNHVNAGKKVKKELSTGVRIIPQTEEKPVEPHLANELPIAKTPTVKPEYKPMAIVHINELDKTPQQSTPVSLVSQQPVNFAKLPVVHLNDVVREETTIRSILKDSRLRIGQLQFRNTQPMNDDAPTILNNQLPGNPLKFNINIQN